MDGQGMQGLYKQDGMKTKVSAAYAHLYLIWKRMESSSTVVWKEVTVAHVHLYTEHVWPTFCMAGTGIGDEGIEVQDAVNPAYCVA
jgi:hypothetical protein